MIRMFLIAACLIACVIPTLAGPCESACWTETEKFVIQCYQAIGDASACTQAGCFKYKNCTAGCGEHIEIACD